MGYFDLPSRWVYVYFEDGLCKNVMNTDSFSNEEAQHIADEWSSSKSGKEHGKVVRVDFQNNSGKLLKFWLIDSNGKMKREPLF